MKNPYIIVTLGPTGSGKTGLINKTISHLKLNSNYQKILIDDLIENNDIYKQNVLEIIKNVEKECMDNCKTTKCNCDNFYTNPTSDLLEKFNKAYYLTRNSPNCVKGYPLDCNSLNDNKLQTAISERKNIVLESTGGYIPKWLLSGEQFSKDVWTKISIPYISATKNPYRIIFAYSVVPFDELIRRNTRRTIQTMHAFLNNPTMAGPRLPDIDYTRFKKVVSQIRDVLMQLYSSCIQTFNEAICGVERIDNLLIFDNSGNEMKIAYDSKNEQLSEQAFLNLVNKLFGFEMHKKVGLNKKSMKKIKKNRSRKQRNQF